MGFVILNGTDPTQILQRSDEPILSPQLEWEVSGLTANVVFAEGWIRLEGAANPDTFLVFYGAADTCVGAAALTVTASS